MQTVDEIWELRKRIASQRRAGWIIKGSRAKKNETILISRVELLDIIDNLMGKTSRIQSIYDELTRKGIELDD